jgi:hypothetical protein
LCPYFQQYMHCIITLPPFYDLTVQALKLIEQRFFDVVALVELDVLGSPVGVHASSLTTQCPPLAGPMRFNLSSAWSFRIFRSIDLSVIPIFEVISGMVMEAFCKISSIIFSDVFPDVVSFAPERALSSDSAFGCAGNSLKKRRPTFFPKGASVAPHHIHLPVKGFDREFLCLIGNAP